MPTMIETEERLRRTLHSVASSVHDSGEVTPDLDGALPPMATARGVAGTQGRPLLVFVASFLSVLVAGAVTMLVAGHGSDPASVAMEGGGVRTDPIATGLGMDGAHFAIDDDRWVLAEAWETSDGGPGTYLIYGREDEQVVVLTGSPASRVAVSSGSGTTRTMNSNQVTEQSIAGEFTFEWTTSEGMPVSVTFSGMDRDRALEVAADLRPIDSEAWEELLKAARAAVEARTGVSGAGGEEGTGEWIRLDSPEAPDVILELAEEIELPPGKTFDRLIANLPDEPTEMTEQGVMSMIEFQAGCIWTGYWLDAVEAGDTEARDRALAVLEEIPTWPTLNATDGGGVVDAWSRNAAFAISGDVQGVLDNLYTNNCTDVVPGN